MERFNEVVKNIASVVSQVWLLLILALFIPAFTIVILSMFIALPLALVIICYSIVGLWAIIMYLVVVFVALKVIE